MPCCCTHHLLPPHPYPPPTPLLRPPTPPPLQVLQLRSTSDAVRAAVVEAAAELASRGAALTQAASAPALLGALIDLWEGIAELLTDDTGARCVRWAWVDCKGGAGMRWEACTAGRVSSALGKSPARAPPHPTHAPHECPAQTWCAPPPPPRWLSCWRRSGAPRPTPPPPSRSPTSPPPLTAAWTRCWDWRSRASGEQRGEGVGRGCRGLGGLQWCGALSPRLRRTRSAAAGATLAPPHRQLLGVPHPLT